MSNELLKAGQTYLAKSDNSSLKREAGKSLVAVGGGGIALSVLAGALPFVTLPLLLLLSVVLGGYWWWKG